MNPVNRHYDAITPFFRTFLDFENMPLGSKHPARKNLEIHNYESGHMIYLVGHSQAVGYRWLPRPFHGDRVSSKPSVGSELLRRISHR